MAALPGKADLSAILDAISDYAVITLDADGLVTSWNSQTRSFGCRDGPSPGL